MGQCIHHHPSVPRGLFAHARSSDPSDRFTTLFVRLIMSLKLYSIIVWVGLLCCLNNIAFAQDAPAGAEQDVRTFKHPLTDMPRAAEDVVTSVYFPNHADHKLPIGEVVTTLCHFTNTGSAPYNISAIMGSLNAPYDFRHHFQNYSYKPIGMVINGGEEISLKYTFQLHPELEPVDYQLAVTVFYDSESESFSTTFFNQTVELYSPVAEYDLETVGSVLYSLVATAFVALVSVFACFPDSKITIRIKKMLKKIAPQLMEQPGYVNVDISDDDSDGDAAMQSKLSKRGKRA